MFIQLYKYFKKNMYAFVLVTLLGLSSTFCYFLLPQVAQIIIDRCINAALGVVPGEGSSVFLFLLADVADNDYWIILLRALGVYGTLVLYRYIAHYVRWNAAHRNGIICEARLRAAVFNKLLTQNTLVLSKYSSGELLTTANADCIAVKDIFVHYFPIFFQQFVELFMAAFFLLRISPFLAIAPFMVGIITSLTMIAYIKKMQRIFREIRSANVELNSCVQENIGGVKIVRAFAREDAEIKKFNEKNETYKKAFFRHADTWSAYSSFFLMASYLINISSTVVGIILAVNGTITSGEFGSFFLYVYFINNAMQTITNFGAQLQQSSVAGKRIADFLSAPDILSDTAGTLKAVGKPNIRLDNVSVTLDGQRKLSGVTVDIPYGKRLGLIGRTGSGKSVLMKTIARYFEPSEGKILLNGSETREYELQEIRRQFGYVLQDVFLFSNTVDANIAFYNPDLPHQNVIDAGITAQANDFIMRLPAKYETIIGERGLGLSGGQKQRVSIARALIKDAPVIMLDDCTSALDMETERRAFRAISDKYADRTLIIASHRAAALAACDEILFLSDGQIIERGTHGELMALSGHYAQVYTAQAAALEGVIS
ncbi:MAG: ABC transporter ATP-binding protein/permease [Clostridiales bacterium]|jgi:ATP-binding cassette subfamily B protein|nr:ABC transporter ATP-binding protein/permease [Clostridiales bacterium]